MFVRMIQFSKIPAARIRPSAERCETTQRIRDSLPLSPSLISYPACVAGRANETKKKEKRRRKKEKCVGKDATMEEAKEKVSRNGRYSPVPSKRVKWSFYECEFTVRACPLFFFSFPLVFHPPAHYLCLSAHVGPTFLLFASG